MNLTEQFLQILFDHIIAGLIVPIHSANILFMVSELNPNIFYYGLIFAFLGNIFGSILNFILGYVIANALFNVKKSNSIKKYQKFYYFMILVPFDFIGTIISFLAGFGHMNKKRFLIFLTLVNFIYFLGKALLFFFK